MKKLLLTSLFILISHGLFALEENPLFEEKKFSVPNRNVSIIASEEGFYPEVVTVFSGEKVNFFLTSISERPSCFVIAEKKLFMAARNKEVTTGSTFFMKPGVHEYYCPTGKIKGKIVVIERESERRKRISREIASKNKVKIWRPRND